APCSPPADPAARGPPARARPRTPSPRSRPRGPRLPAPRADGLFPLQFRRPPRACGCPSGPAMPAPPRLARHGESSTAPPGPPGANLGELPLLRVPGDLLHEHVVVLLVLLLDRLPEVPALRAP